jgi:hypothetical protein
VDLGCAYPALRELEAEGLLAKYKGKRTSERTGLSALYYKLTPAGRRQAGTFSFTTALIAAVPVPEATMPAPPLASPYSPYHPPKA